MKLTLTEDGAYREPNRRKMRRKDIVFLKNRQDGGKDWRRLAGRVLRGAQILLCLLAVCALVDFLAQGESWMAQVTDASAHAWVEIFLEDYGWTPIEVTPDAQGQISALYPGLDGAALRDLAEGFWQDDRLGKLAGEMQREAEAQQKEEAGYSVIFDVRRYREIYLVAGACLICVLLFLPVLMDDLRLRRRQKLNRMGCRKVYALMMDMLHGAGYFPEMEGWEKEFPETAAQEFPEVGEDLLRRQQEIVKRAAYGGWTPDGESEQFVRWVFLLLAEAVEGRRKGQRRLRP